MLEWTEFLESQGYRLSSSVCLNFTKSYNLIVGKKCLEKVEHDVISLSFHSPRFLIVQKLRNDENDLTLRHIRHFLEANNLYCNEKTLGDSNRDSIKCFQLIDENEQNLKQSYHLILQNIGAVLKSSRWQCRCFMSFERDA